MTADATGRKTTVDHWDGAWSRAPRMRLPSPWNIAIRDLQRLLRAHVRPGSRFLEIGCAPGKLLAWVAHDLRADVSGLDYSERGLTFARQLFEALNLRADLRCEDLATTSFAPQSFDVVFSAGVIEHFDDPGPIVRRHVALVKPGGTALITIPNYGGLYRRLQRHFDPDNLGIHNLTIMTPSALEALAPRESVRTVKAYAAGRMSPWLVNFDKRWPAPVARAFALMMNGAGLVQPFDVAALSPTLVLELLR
jgi:2-polyprenyl-3-methyl-5-hydroxy-6-metoxy-1,4-benzoquinol methylase